MKVKIVAIFFAVCFLGFTPQSKANELDNAAACSGVVLGNASIDYSFPKVINRHPSIRGNVKRINFTEAF